MTHINYKILKLYLNIQTDQNFRKSVMKRQLQ